MKIIRHIEKIYKRSGFLSSTQLAEVNKKLANMNKKMNVNSTNESKNQLSDISILIISDEFFLTCWIETAKSLWKILKLKTNTELELAKSMYIKEDIERRFDYLKSNPRKMIDSILKRFKKQLLLIVWYIKINIIINVS